MMLSGSQKVNVNGKQTVSLTFGDAGENHVGNQMIGSLGEVGDGFTCEELLEMCGGGVGEYYDFGNDAGVAVFRGFVVDQDVDLLEEMNSFEWDQKFWDSRRKKVLNKHARTNVTFLDGVGQEPDYENGKGRIVDVDTIPVFQLVRARVIDVLKGLLSAPDSKSKLDNLVCEGNNYYDNTKCGIGFHGDGERRRVIAVRVGASMPMKWQWFQNSTAQGDAFEFTFNGGDMYIMSEKAVGTNWKCRKPLTLRHSAGCAKYTTIAAKKPPAKRKAKEVEVEVE
jgi:hypothetical protein